MSGANHCFGPPSISRAAGGMSTARRAGRRMLEEIRAAEPADAAFLADAWRAMSDEVGLAPSGFAAGWRERLIAYFSAGIADGSQLVSRPSRRPAGGHDRRIRALVGRRRGPAPPRRRACGRLRRARMPADGVGAPARDPRAPVVSNVRMHPRHLANVGRGRTVVPGTGIRGRPRTRFESQIT